MSFWKTCVNEVLGKFGVLDRAGDVDRQLISRVYERAGGKWVALLDGDSASWGLLRAVTRTLIKRRGWDDE